MALPDPVPERDGEKTSLERGESVPEGEAKSTASVSSGDPELEWLEHVYQGDKVPQLTTRAVLMGLVLGSVMAFSNLYVGLKTGWSLGVAITSCIMSWAIFKALRPLLGSEPSVLENNCMQSTASAAGYSTGTTLVSAFSAYLLITKQHLPWPLVMGLVFSIAMLGVFLAIPMKRNMVNIERLPFPSGTAAAETLRSLYTAGAEAMRKARALFTSMALGALVAFLRDGMADLTERLKWGVWAEYLTIPNFLPLSKWLRRIGWDRAAIVFDTKGYTFDLELSTILVGAGAIIGIRVGTSMLLGAVFCYGVLAPIMHAMPAGEGHTVIHVLGYRGIVSWSVWGGVSLMTTAALLNFGLQWRTLARAVSGIGSMFSKKGHGAKDPLAEVEVPSSWFLIGTLVSGALCVLLNYWAFHIALWLGALAVLISSVLAIVACRATGETDTTPIGALGKITQLTYGLLIPQNITANLMTANITSSVAASSADLLNDLKSGYLLGANPRKQFLAQFFGVFAGTLVAVPGFYILVPRAEVLGGDKFPAPAAQVWKAVAELLGKGIDSLHPTALYAMVVGGVLGIVITLLEKAFPRHRHLIPSPTGIGLAFVIPGWNSVSMFLGSLIAWSLEKRRPKTAEAYTIPVASGLIAGESLMGVFIAVFGVLYDFLSK
jgi:OPT family oligopeptide transporter